MTQLIDASSLNSQCGMIEEIFRYLKRWEETGNEDCVSQAQMVVSYLSGPRDVTGFELKTWKHYRKLIDSTVNSCPSGWQEHEMCGNDKPKTWAACRYCTSSL